MAGVSRPRVSTERRASGMAAQRMIRFPHGFQNSPSISVDWNSPMKKWGRRVRQPSALQYRKAGAIAGHDWHIGSSFPQTIALLFHLHPICESGTSPALLEQLSPAGKHAARGDEAGKKTEEMTFPGNARAKWKHAE